MNEIRRYDITSSQRRWLETLWKAFGDPFSEMSYGVGHEGCARMKVQNCVFVVDRETNRVSVELAIEAAMDLLDSDSPDYDPDAFAALVDHDRKARKES